MAALMDFDSRKIPLLKSFANSVNSFEFQIFIDGNRIKVEDLHRFSIKTKPPKGWIGHIEYDKKS